MSETGSDVSSVNASVRPQNRNLRPFPKGVSGNTSGVAGGGRRFSERYSALQAELEAAGVPLTVREHMDLETAVRLSLRRPKDDHAAAQAASTCKRLLDPLYARRAKAKPVGPTLREYALAKYGPPK